MARLTDKTLAQSTAITPTTLIHIVYTGDSSQNPAGSSYKAELQQLTGIFAGLTFTGGTVNGSTIFTNGVTGNSISATTYENLPISGLTEGNGISITGTNGNYTITVTGSTGTSGSGTSGIDGTSGLNGTSGIDGTSGTSGIDGTSGLNGTSGINGTSGLNGTSGTSGIDATSYQYYTAITISSAEILTIQTSPVIILPSLGTSQYYDYKVLLEYNYGTSPYIGLSQVRLVNDSSAQVSTFISCAGSTNVSIVWVGSIGSVFNTNINLSNISDPTGGDGTFKLKVYYNIVNFG